MSLRLLLPACALGLGTACGFLPEGNEAWYHQLDARSPCFEVDLLDGLDEDSPLEIENLLGCLNHHGHFSSFESLEAGQLTREGLPITLEIARLLNRLPNAEVDVFGLAGLGIDLLNAEDRPIDEFLDLGLELTYGERAAALRSGVVATTDASALRSGVWVPVGQVLPVAARALLDDNLAAADWAADLLSSPETKRWIVTLATAVQSSNPAVSDPSDVLLLHLGEAIGAARSPSNDLWSGSSGDSLRDLAEALVLGPAPLIELIGPEATAIVADPGVRTTLPASLVELHDEGTLQRLGPQLRWMASVDVHTQPLQHGGTSSLHAFLRLLAATNEPMACSLDLWVASLEVNLGNVAVAILEILADMDPDTVTSSTGLLGTVLGWDLSEWILDEIAYSGVCPTLTPQVMQDLRAVDVMAEDEAYPVLVTVLELFRVLKYGQENRLPELADLIRTLEHANAIPPLEEALRDAGDKALIADLVDLVPVLVAPEEFGLEANGQPAVDFQDLLSLLLWVWEEDAGQTGWQRMEPVLSPVLTEDATWQALGNLSALLRDRETQVSRLLQLLGPLVELDPDLTLLDTLAPLVGTRELAEPLLRIIEQGAFTTALLDSEPTGADPETPLAFGGRLVVGGAVDDLLRMVDILFATLEDSR